MTNSSQGYDRYAYVNNNPILYTDPTGHFTDKQIDEWSGHTASWWKHNNLDFYNLLHQMVLGDVWLVGDELGSVGLVADGDGGYQLTFVGKNYKTSKSAQYSADQFANLDLSHLELDRYFPSSNDKKRGYYRAYYKNGAYIPDYLIQSEEDRTVTTAERLLYQAGYSVEIGVGTGVAGCLIGAAVSEGALCGPGGAIGFVAGLVIGVVTSLTVNTATDHNIPGLGWINDLGKGLGDRVLDYTFQNGLTKTVFIRGGDIFVSPVNSQPK